MSDTPATPISGVLVTGASGFIGSALVRRLYDLAHAGNEPYEITALVRKRKDSENDSGNLQGITVVEGNLTDAKTLEFTRDNHADIDVVYHLAAATPDSGASRQTLREVNLDGTKNLLYAVHDHVRHFVYISGVAVFEPGSNSRSVDEDSPKSRQLEYIRTRLEAEVFLRESCAKSGIDLTVVYFADIVYGAAGSFRRIFLEPIRRGRFRIPGSGEYYANFIHLDDAVNILVTIASKRSETSNKSFIASDSTPTPFREFVNLIADELGAKHPGSVPLFLAKAAVGSELIKMLTKDTHASNKRISALYSLQYPSYRTGIPDVVSKYKSSL